MKVMLIQMLKEEEREMMMTKMMNITEEVLVDKEFNVNNNEEMKFQNYKHNLFINLY